MVNIFSLPVEHFNNDGNSPLTLYLSSRESHLLMFLYATFCGLLILVEISGGIVIVVVFGFPRNRLLNPFFVSYNHVGIIGLLHG